MRLFNTIQGPVVENEDNWYWLANEEWDNLLNQPDLPSYLAECQGERTRRPERLLAPIGNQEVWAAGVTYWRSREARMEEAQAAGGGDVYDRVYAAERPEIFFKASSWRVVCHGEALRIRTDSAWNVPEPELVVLFNHEAKIIGYTIGNDMSSRSIEGENPLYLPQAKIYDQSCALGPGILIATEPLPRDTPIQISIEREKSIVFKGETALDQMKRTELELAQWLFKETSFPAGVFLMTGTGIVPPREFTLQIGDIMRIRIPPIGELANIVGE